MNKFLIPTIVSILVLLFSFNPNVADASIIDTIIDSPNPYGIAVDSDTNLIYVTNRSPNTVSVIDGTTNTVIDTISVGNLPTAIAINSDTNLIYVTNSGDDTVSVIDSTTSTVIATIPVGLGPGNVAINSDTNLIYVSNNASINNSPGTISVIDGITNTVVDTISTVFPNPSGVAINSDTNLIYVAIPFFDLVSVIDGTTNTVIDTISVGNFPTQIAINSDTNLIYVTNLGSNFLSVIDGITNTVVDNIVVDPSINTIAINSDTNIIYVTSSFFNTVSAIDGVTTVIIGTTLVGSNLIGIDVNPVTDIIYVTNIVAVHVLDNNFVEICDGIDNDRDGQIDEGCNEDPICSTALSSLSEVWPASNKMIDVSILGVTDPDGDDVTLSITGITQDEPIAQNTDGDGVGTDTAQVRAQKDGSGDGRVYEISFSADDGNGGMCTGSVNVEVPHDQSGTAAIDSGQNHNSLGRLPPDDTPGT